MRKLAIALLICVLSLGIASIAQANLIDNGTFNSNLDHWSTSGDVSWSNAALTGMTGGYAVLGRYWDDGTSKLWQSFSTVGYTQLTISFDYNFIGTDSSPYGGDVDTATASIKKYVSGNWSVANALITDSSPNWANGHFSLTVNVLAPNEEIYFQLSEDGGYCGDDTNSKFAIDNVVVNGVPEPMSMLLLGLGLVGLAGVRRFK